VTALIRQTLSGTKPPANFSLTDEQLRQITLLKPSSSRAHAELRLPPAAAPAPAAPAAPAVAPCFATFARASPPSPLSCGASRAGAGAGAAPPTPCSPRTAALRRWSPGSVRPPTSPRRRRRASLPPLDELAEAAMAAAAAHGGSADVVAISLELLDNLVDLPAPPAALPHRFATAAAEDAAAAAAAAPAAAAPKPPGLGPRRLCETLAAVRFAAQRAPAPHVAQQACLVFASALRTSPELGLATPLPAILAARDAAAAGRRSPPPSRPHSPVGAMLLPPSIDAAAPPRLGSSLPPPRPRSPPAFDFWWGDEDGAAAPDVIHVAPYDRPLAEARGGAAAKRGSAAAVAAAPVAAECAARRPSLRAAALELARGALTRYPHHPSLSGAACVLLHALAHAPAEAGAGAAPDAAPDAAVTGGGGGGGGGGGRVRAAELLEAGAMHVALRVCATADGGSPALVRDAVGLLRWLGAAEPGCVDSLVRAGGARAALRVMERHRSDAHLQEAGCALLTSVALAAAAAAPADLPAEARRAEARAAAAAARVGGAGSAGAAGAAGGARAGPGSAAARRAAATPPSPGAAAPPLLGLPVGALLAALQHAATEPAMRRDARLQLQLLALARALAAGAPRAARALCEPPVLRLLGDAMGRHALADQGGRLGAVGVASLLGLATWRGGGPAAPGGGPSLAAAAGRGGGPGGGGPSGGGPALSLASRHLEHSCAVLASLLASSAAGSGAAPAAQQAAARH